MSLNNSLGPQTRTQSEVIEELVHRALEDHHSGNNSRALEDRIRVTAQGLGVSHSYLRSRVFNTRDDLIRRGF